MLQRVSDTQNRAITGSVLQHRWLDASELVDCLAALTITWLTTLVDISTMTAPGGGGWPGQQLHRTPGPALNTNRDTASYLTGDEHKVPHCFCLRCCLGVAACGMLFGTPRPHDLY